MIYDFAKSLPKVPALSFPLPLYFLLFAFYADNAALVARNAFA